MVFTCQGIKRTDSLSEGAAGKVDIDGSGMQGSMSHKGFNGKQVGAVFVQMRAKGMAEGMAGKPALPSQPVLMGMDMP